MKINTKQIEMREIKFRGKRKNFSPTFQNEWIYGNLLNNCTIGEVGAGLDCYSYVEVIPETVGQFTGLKDKNDNDIYQGDRIKIHQFLFDGDEYESELTCVIEAGEFGWIAAQIIHDGVSEYMGYSKEDQLNGIVNTYLINLYGLHEESFEIIGNIHQK